MAAHQITYEGGYHRYRPWRYELLTPALGYAMRAPGDNERGA